MSDIKKEINASQSSSEISVNAKEQWSAKVKVYADTIEESWALALAHAEYAQTVIKEKNA